MPEPSLVSDWDNKAYAVDHYTFVGTETEGHHAHRQSSVVKFFTPPWHESATSHEAGASHCKFASGPEARRIPSQGFSSSDECQPNDRQRSNSGKSKLNLHTIEVLKFTDHQQLRATISLPTSK